MSGDLRRIANSPDGARYEVIGSRKDWKLGTGSVLVDAAAFVWAVIRQARGKEWVVSVRPVEPGADAVIRRLVKTEDDAVSSVTELADAIQSGELVPPDK